MADNFNRFENECKQCSCYVDNWDSEIESEDIDTDCTLEQETSAKKPCWGFDPILK